MPWEMGRPASRILSGGGAAEAVTEPVALEMPWTLMVNGHEWATVLASSDDPTDLMYGFAASESLIRAADDITVLVVDREAGQVWMRIPNLPPDRREPSRRILSGCCGRGHPGLLYATADRELGPVASLRVWPRRAVVRMMHDLAEAEPDRRASGGLHAAGLHDGSRLLVSRFDVGRHNTLDKVHGWCLRHHVQATDAAVVFSGRLSSEVAIKVARIGAGLVISNAAPTSLGLDLCETLNITAVGFVRPDHYNVYTHVHRLADD